MGRSEKLAAHRDGLLHRAVSVIIWNDRGEMLLQRRARGKYHSAGLWSNACCGHPRPGEDVKRAAERRLHEELCVTAHLRPLFAFTYRAQVGDGLTEHEYDHVFESSFSGTPTPNLAEVDAWRWTPVARLRADLAAQPERYTVWFKLLVGKLET